jgi:hypothetical protein
MKSAARAQADRIQRIAGKWTFRLRHRAAWRRRIALGRTLAADGSAGVLRRDGYLDWTDRVDQEQLARLQAELTAWPAARIAVKEYFQRLSPDGAISHDSPLVRLALDPALIAVAADYLGEVPYLPTVEVIRSTRASSSAGYQKTQLWHMDRHVTRILKLFIYLNDVDGNNGPFMFVPASVDRQRRLPYTPSRKADWLVERVLGAGYPVREVQGKAGTAFLIDTATLLHRGSRIASEAHRMAYVATYTTFVPYKLPRESRIGRDGVVSEIERLVLNRI